MPPVFVPNVQAKVLATLEVRLRLGLVPLQTLAVAGVVRVGRGFTVTVIAVAEPAHEPAEEVGVTLYTILPAPELPGLVKV